MKAHIKKFHSEAAKRKAAETDELARLELLHTDKVQRLSVKHQTGGTVMTCGTKQVSEKTNPAVKAAKNENDQEINVDKSDEYGGGSDPLFKHTLTKWGSLKTGKKGRSLIRSLLLPWSNAGKQHQTKI